MKEKLDSITTIGWTEETGMELETAIKRNISHGIGIDKQRLLLPRDGVVDDQLYHYIETSFGRLLVFRTKTSRPILECDASIPVYLEDGRV